MNEKKSVRKETTNRSKTLHIAKIFRKYSDESHPLKQQDVLDYLEKDYHYMPNRKTVSSAIEDLEEYGEMTFGRTKNEGIYLKNRPFGERDALFLMAMVYGDRNRSPEEKKTIVNSILSGFSDSQKKVLESYLSNAKNLDSTGLEFKDYKILNQCANSKATGSSSYRRYVYIKKTGERVGNFYHPLPGPIPAFEAEGHDSSLFHRDDSDGRSRGIRPAGSGREDTDFANEQEWLRFHNDFGQKTGRRGRRQRSALLVHR